MPEHDGGQEDHRRSGNDANIARRKRTPMNWTPSAADTVRRRDQPERQGDDDHHAHCTGLMSALLVSSVMIGMKMMMAGIASHRIGEPFFQRYQLLE